MPRSCGKCRACCIAPEVESLGKPAWKACEKLQPGCKGCSVYGDRPESCRTFECAWLTSLEMPTRFRPDRCGIMLVGRPGGTLQAWEVGNKFHGSRVERYLERIPHGYELRVMAKEKEEV